MDYDIDSLVNDIDFKANSISYIKGEIVLTNSEVLLLKEYGIDYTSFKSMSRLINAFSEYSDSDERVSEALVNMQDRNYYLNVNK